MKLGLQGVSLIFSTADHGVAGNTENCTDDGMPLPTPIPSLHPHPLPLAKQLNQTPNPSTLKLTNPKGNSNPTSPPRART